MTHDEYVGLDATGLAELVASGDVTASELLEIALARLDALNPALNAVVHRMEDDARRAAQQPADGPFRGVPFLAKDLTTMYAGHPTSSGSRFLKDHVVTWDSEMAVRVKAAGLVVAGKTNTPEWGLLPVTESELWGPCRNPWDTSRTPGGSSGGAGASVSAGIVPMAGGGDGGGSIRIPASCCGIFGLKPTSGRTPSGPRRGRLWRGAAVEHVLTRSVRDSATMLDATQGPDTGAPIHLPPPARAYRDEVGAPPGRLRIAWSTEPHVPTDVHPDCVAAVHDAARLLEELGHEVVEDRVPIDGPAFARTFVTLVAGELGADVEEAAAAVGRQPRRSDLEPATWALALLSHAVSAREFAAALRWIEVMGRDVGRFFESYDVLLTPTLSSPPVAIGAIAPTRAQTVQLKGLGTRGSGRVVKAGGPLEAAGETDLCVLPWTPIYNVTGQPAMSVPLFWNDDRLPVGVHLVGRFAREDVLFRLAGQLEEARPWLHRLPEMARQPI